MTKQSLSAKQQENKMNRLIKISLIALFACMPSLHAGGYAQTTEKESGDERRQRSDSELRSTIQSKKLEQLIPVGKTVQYDRFKDITTVSTEGMVVYPMDRVMSFKTAHLGLLATYDVQGQFGIVPPTVRLFVTGQSLLVGTPNTPCSLSMILNGSTRVQFGQMQYGRPSPFAYIAWVDMSLGSFRALATASSIEMQSCRFETTLNPRHISGLAALLEGLPQTTSTPASGGAIGPIDPHIGIWKFGMTRDGVPEDWILQIDGRPGALKGILKMGRGGEIALTNILSAGSFLSGGASEIVQGGMNMITFSGQTSNNAFKGTLTLWLLGKQQSPIPFEAKRISVP